MKNIVITCILLLFSYQLMAEKIYKWVDKDGNIHYSAQKPVNQDVETVKVRKGPRVKDQDSQEEQTDIKGVQPLQSGSDDEAEAQAREAKIETALERIRAASMAMHTSKDFPGIANIVLNQIDYHYEVSIQS